MGSRIFVGTFLLVGILSAGTTATSGHRPAPTRHTAVAYLSEPTWIGSTMVQGAVLFTHDDTKMAHGEPCTTVFLIQNGAEPSPAANDPFLEIASFHCIPSPHQVVSTFTLTSRPNAATGFGCVLTGYQFAGEAEIHHLPTSVDSH
jgi:hypothetical protein